MRTQQEKGQTQTINGHTRYATKKDKPRSYMTIQETRTYLSNLEAVERRSKATRDQHIKSGFNPLLGLRRALKDGLEPTLRADRLPDSLEIFKIGDPMAPS